jgi:hypothetical protein
VYGFRVTASLPLLDGKDATQFKSEVTADFAVHGDA